MDYDLIILIIMVASLVLTYLHKRTRYQAFFYIWIGLKLVETQVRKLITRAHAQPQPKEKP